MADLERVTRFELATLTLGRSCPTIGPHPLALEFWSGWRESNPHGQLGRLELYH